ncbi:hypothetical protein IFM89_031926 [Coptis chinensis]|uniref:Uncharacterized protein n=1 Tax=Coptis chinensis TaxID=261450 RepID=A0A835MAJ8_9MAGN|nr:hypothetical protein IFM89_031926 [Coptis chinensis]
MFGTACVKYSAFLPAVLGFLLSVYLLKSIGSDMSGQESTESTGGLKGGSEPVDTKQAVVTITKILLETREEVAGQQSHRRIIADSSATSNARDPTRSQSHSDSSRGMELCELID